MKILLLGSGGRLGRCLDKRLSSYGHVFRSTREIADLRFPSSLVEVLDDFRPDLIVNAAAFTDVVNAETRPDVAYTVNAEAVHVLATEAASRRIPFIHFSTDYVFDGCKSSSYLETDETDPINVYGKTKLAGDNFIRDSGCDHIIIRSSSLFGSHGDNFVTKILKLLQSKEELQIVDDRYFAPTSYSFVAECTEFFVNQVANGQTWASGIYNVAPMGQTTPFESTNLLLKLAVDQDMRVSIRFEDLLPIPSAKFADGVKRPSMSLLNTEKIRKYYPIRPSTWDVDFIPFAQRKIKEICQN